MAYNNDIDSITAQFYAQRNKEGNNNIVQKWQDDLLLILSSSFLRKLNDEENDDKGLVIVKFEKPFLKMADNGYFLVENLVDSQQFDSFARKYAISLGKIDSRCDEYHTAYYEVIWNYRKYFASFSIDQINLVIDSLNHGSDILKEMIVDFTQLPSKYQVEVLKIFSKTVNTSEQSRDDIKDFLCTKIRKLEIK